MPSGDAGRCDRDYSQPEGSRVLFGSFPGSAEAAAVKKLPGGVLGKPALPLPPPRAAGLGAAAGGLPALLQGSPATRGV